MSRQAEGEEQHAGGGLAADARQRRQVARAPPRAGRRRASRGRAPASPIARRICWIRGPFCCAMPPGRIASSTSVGGGVANGLPAREAIAQTSVGDVAVAVVRVLREDRAARARRSGGRAGRLRGTPVELAQRGRGSPVRARFAWAPPRARPRSRLRAPASCRRGPAPTAAGSASPRAAPCPSRSWRGRPARAPMKASPGAHRRDDLDPGGRDVGRGRAAQDRPSRAAASPRRAARRPAQRVRRAAPGPARR